MKNTDNTRGESEDVDVDGDVGQEEDIVTVTQGRPKRKRKELNFADSAYGLQQAALLESINDENDPDDFSHKMVNKKKKKQSAKAGGTAKKGKKQDAAESAPAAGTPMPSLDFGHCNEPSVLTFWTLRARNAATSDKEGQEEGNWRGRSCW
jgi:hypothetical protein